MNELENLTTAERNALQEALKENREPMSVNEVKEMLLRTEKGAVKSTIGNCLIVLQMIHIWQEHLLIIFWQ